LKVLPPTPGEFIAADAILARTGASLAVPSVNFGVAMLEKRGIFLGEVLHETKP
jgi:hypothetical protein